MPRELVKLPEAGAKIRQLWKSVAQIGRVINALADLRIIPGATRNRLSLTEANAVLELAITGGGGATPETHVWQPYLSPTATGSAAGRTIRIRLGNVKDLTGNIWFPARRNIEIEVPANRPDGYFVWLKATLSADGAIFALDYGHGPNLPTGVPPVTDGAGTAPGFAYDLLFMLTSDATSVDLASAVIQRRVPLTLVPQIVGGVTGGVTRVMVWLDRFVYQQPDYFSTS